MQLLIRGTFIEIQNQERFLFRPRTINFLSKKLNFNDRKDYSWTHSTTSRIDVEEGFRDKFPAGVWPKRNQAQSNHKYFPV